MDTKSLIPFFGIVLVFAGCSRPKPNPSSLPPPSNPRSQLCNQAPDSALTEPAIQFSNEDSLRFLSEGPDSTYPNSTSDFNAAFFISPSSPIMYLRCAVRLRHHEHGIGNFGGFLFKYLPRDQSLPTKEIMLDSIKLTIGNLDMPWPNVAIVDINNDGYNDVMVSLGENSSGNSFANSFLVFDPESNAFRLDTTNFTEFQDKPIFVNGREKEIHAGGRDGLRTGWSETYRWNGQRYVPFSKDETEYADTTLNLIHNHLEFQGGVWRVTKSDTEFSN